MKVNIKVLKYQDFTEIHSRNFVNDANIDSQK